MSPHRADDNGIEDVYPTVVVQVRTTLLVATPHVATARILLFTLILFFLLLPVCGAPLWICYTTKGTYFVFQTAHSVPIANTSHRGEAK